MKPTLSGDVATTLLTEALAARRCKPSDGLIVIFARAGEVARERLPGRHRLTTRLLLFAVAEISSVDLEDIPALSAPEKRSIRAVGELLRDSERYTVLNAAYFESSAKPEDQPLKDPTLSHNLDGLLTRLTDRPRAEGEEVSVVSADEFLMAFPPAESLADKLLGELSITLDELRESVSSAVEHANERVATHQDEPAKEDELGRLAFARVLADRIRDAHEWRDPDHPSAFIVHLHGPWGSGKSSVLNFLGKELRDDKWIVVNFNAWREQHLHPPWWLLITAIYSAALSKPRWRAPILWLRWLGWRVRADYAPLVAAGACLAGLLLLVLWLGDRGVGEGGNVVGPREEIASALDKLLKVIATAITVGAAVVLGSRSLAMGSRRAAQTYADLKSDPFEPITRLFSRLIKAIRKPVVVFVDDLDRCDEKYVVELLEGIQTLMRGAAVTYVIAADRKWICSSFEQRYKDFAATIGEPGRPLGYLFLDKIFQISAAIPQLSDDLQRSYWETLLETKKRPAKIRRATLSEQVRQGGEPAPEPPGATVQDRYIREAEDEALAYTTHAELRAFVNREEERAKKFRNKMIAHAARAAAARQITSEHAARDTRHQLRDFAPLIEPNPRAMKRLVNAYAMHQASLFLTGRDPTHDALARWTILELRWPLLADFLAVRPWCADRLRDRLDDTDMPEVPKELRGLFGDEFVRNTVGKAGRKGLNCAAIRSILGAEHER